MLVFNVYKSRAEFIIALLFIFSGWLYDCLYFLHFHAGYISNLFTSFSGLLLCLFYYWYYFFRYAPYFMTGYICVFIPACSGLHIHLHYLCFMGSLLIFIFSGWFQIFISSLYFQGRLYGLSFIFRLITCQSLLLIFQGRL